RKARSEGQVARSAELVTAVILLSVLWAAPSLVPRLGRQLSENCMRTIAAAAQGAINPDGLGYLASRSLIQVGTVAGPVLGLVAAGALVSNVLQVGLHFSPSQLQPKLSRVDPLQGLQRLFAGRSAVELLKGILKVALVGTCGWR